MQTSGKFISLLAFWAVIGWSFGNATNLYAVTPLGGAALENGCQAYADKAVSYAKEWEQFQCQKKLSVACRSKRSSPWNAAPRNTATPTAWPGMRKPARRRSKSTWRCS